MNSSWQLKKFGECAELIRDTCLPDEVEEAPYIGLEHIEEGTLRLLEVGNSNDVISTKSRFEPGDILFGKLRPYFRKVVRPSFSGICSTDIWVVRAKHSADQGYLFYWMASQEFVNSATQASEGTKMPRAKWDFLERIEKTVPPLPEQRAIAHNLGTLDDKIELNRRMNQTLEAMAQALFKSWFLDFEPFRDQGMQDSPLGEIPVGWRVVTLGDLGEIVCGKTPPTADEDNYGGDIPFITIPDMHNKVFVTRTTKYLTKKGAATQPKKLLPKHSVCVSCIATPGLVAITSEPSHTNQQINSIICNSMVSPYWCYLAVTAIREEIIVGGAGGSATLNLNKAEFSKLQVIKPDSGTIKKFHNRVEPIFSQILSNDLQSITLSSIRDTLLPKLLSGGIRVKDAEKFVVEKNKTVGQTTQAIYTIGHSNHSIEDFIRLLKRHNITAVADVRSAPVSKHNPQFNMYMLSVTLRKENISYVFMGKELGGRPDDPSCCDNGQVNYLKTAEKPIFKEGIKRLLRGKDQHRIVLLCAEKEPLDCHRTILVSRNLYKMGIPVKHILANGEIEDHHDTEQRMVRSLGIGNELFDYSLPLTERIEKAYREQTSKIAYRLYHQEERNEHAE